MIYGNTILAKDEGEEGSEQVLENWEDQFFKDQGISNPLPHALLSRRVDKDETEEQMTMFGWKEELKGKPLIKGTGQDKERVIC